MPSIMPITLNRRVVALSLTALFLAACGKKEEAPAPAPAASPAETKPAAAVAAPLDDEKVLNIYNWPDYIAQSIIPEFEKETGIKVNYQTFETNEALHAKLVAGNSGYDIVVPGSVFVKPQIEGGLLQPLDKNLLSSYGNLDAGIMSKLTGVDAENKHVVPWAWSYTTVGINKTKVLAALGSTPMPENAWDLIFKPEYTSKLKSCGIAFLDSPTEVIPAALHYIGKNAYSNDPADYKLAGEALSKVRKDVRIFSSTMIDDIAGGKACVALAWAGDVNIAANRAKENGSGDEIVALVPSTGGLIFFDTMALPKDAKHVKNAHAFINFYLRKDIAAKQTNELNYPTGNSAALSDIAPEISNNKTIFVDEAAMAKMVSPGSFSNEARAAMANVYTGFKKGK